MLLELVQERTQRLAFMNTVANFCCSWLWKIICLA